MTWSYSQQTGELFAEGGITALAQGYSGHGEGVNNGALEDVPDVGPIPRGKYIILFPRDTEQEGPYVMPLLPDAANQMHGRSGFLIHGDLTGVILEASLGCIIMPRFARERVWESGDHSLEVIA